MHRLLLEYNIILPGRYNITRSTMHSTCLRVVYELVINYGRIYKHPEFYSWRLLSLLVLSTRWLVCIETSDSFIELETIPYPQTF